MTVAEYILKRRLELKDFGELHKDLFDGDATIKNFIINHVPIKDNSYAVTVGGSAQTENSDYTLDKDTGVLTFTSAPASGSDNVVIAYQSVRLRDEDYMEFLKDAIDYFRWKFWKKAIDTSTLTTVKDQYEYDVSGITGILYIMNVEYKGSSGSTVWIPVQSVSNWKYRTQLEQLVVNPPFNIDSLAMKLYYLKEIAKPTLLADTLDIPDEWLTPYNYYIHHRFYEFLISEKIHETGAVTTNPNYAPAELVFNMAARYLEKADKIASRIAPKLPPMPIKNELQGINIV